MYVDGISTTELHFALGRGHKKRLDIYRATLLLCLILDPRFPPRVISQFEVTVVHLSVDDSLCYLVNLIRF